MRIKDAYGFTALHISVTFGSGLVTQQLAVEFPRLRRSFQALSVHIRAWLLRKGRRNARATSVAITELASPLASGLALVSTQRPDYEPSESSATYVDYEPSVSSVTGEMDYEPSVSTSDGNGKEDKESDVDNASFAS